MRVNLQPAFILHHRAYRETSVLLDIFSRDYGRVSLIARGARGPKSKQRSLLRPFMPLLLSWQGKTELMNLQTIEPQGNPLQLRGDFLLSGFYLNELLTRLLQKQDPYPQLYNIYYNTLLKLENAELHEQILRLFEKKLLEELGYGLQLQHELFVADKFYRFHPEQGFKLCEYHQVEQEPSSMLFSGKSLLAFSSEVFADEDCLRDAKRLMRIALFSLLGSQPLHSRKLFVEVIK